MTDDDKNSHEAAGGFDPARFFDYMQKSWQAMPVAGAMQTGGTLGDLDKRIAELRVVEQWLEVNLNMLRTSIQAFEVQRGTLAALQAFGEQLGATPPGRAAEAPEMPGGPALAAFTKAFQQMTDASQSTLLPWWQNLQQQFQTVAAGAMRAQGTPETGTTSAEGSPADPSSSDAGGAARRPAGRKGRSDAS